MDDWTDTEDPFAALNAIPEGIRGVGPKLDITHQGNNTIIKNFTSIQTKLKRDLKHLRKFITNELGMKATLEGKQLILHGKLSKAKIQDVIDSYIGQYVICPLCGKPDTLLQRAKKKESLKCTACGQISEI